MQSFSCKYSCRYLKMDPWKKHFLLIVDPKYRTCLGLTYNALASRVSCQRSGVVDYLTILYRRGLPDNAPASRVNLQRSSVAIYLTIHLGYYVSPLKAHIFCVYVKIVLFLLCCISRLLRWFVRAVMRPFAKILIFFGQTLLVNRKWSAKSSNITSRWAAPRPGVAPRIIIWYVCKSIFRL